MIEDEMAYMVETTNVSLASVCGEKPDASVAVRYLDVGLTVF